jgi:alpha-N-arabinofuranosidase
MVPSLLTLFCLFTLTAGGNVFAGEKSGSLQARIKLDIDRTIGEIDPKIYGNFIEHLGRCIYGGIYDPESPFADKDGFRNDVLEAARQLKVSIIRWPGGNFASGYHWQDGIGPKNSRPKRIELAWNAVETNQVGTDEYIKYCRKLGAEPYICINLGTGTWDEARNWVEYCNRETGTYFPDLRAKNGSSDPYKVKYWALGNEMDGGWQMGHRNAEEYSKFALEAAKLMKWVDPSIKLVASGSSYFSSNWTTWDRTILDYLKDHIDYIALHTYVGNADNNYYKFLASTLDVEERIKVVEGLILETTQKTHRDSPIYIAFDEWNVWYRAWTEQGLEETYNLEDALVDAQFLNCFVRNAHIVKMANIAQLVNVIAPLRANAKGSWRQTIYYPLELFANHCTGTALQAHVVCDTFNVGARKGIPYLDVSSSFNASTHTLVVNVVNRHRDQSIVAEILAQTGRFAQEGAAYEVNGADVKAQNSPEEQNIRTVQKQFVTDGSDQFFYRFPPHSFTLITIGLQDKEN